MKLLKDIWSKNATSSATLLIAKNNLMRLFILPNKQRGNHNMSGGPLKGGNFFWPEKSFSKGRKKLILKKCILRCL